MKHPFENFYCAICKCTTRHTCKCNDETEAAIALAEAACLKCGILKYKSHPVKESEVVKAPSDLLQGSPE